MIDEIFEMIMKEARARRKNNLYLAAFSILLELNERLTNARKAELGIYVDVKFKDDRTP